MKRLLQFAAVFLLSVSPCRGVISWVSTAKKQQTTAATTNAIASVSITAGNTIVVECGTASNAATISSVSDPAGNTYAIGPGIANSTTNWAGIAYVLSATALSAQTVTFTASTTSICFVEQYSGATSIGNTGTAMGSSTNPNVAITIQDSNNFVVGTETHRSTAAITANQGTLRDIATGSTGVPAGGAMDNTSASPASVTIGDTLSASAAWAAAAIELRSGTSSVAAGDSKSQKLEKLDP